MHKLSTSAGRRPHHLAVAKHVAMSRHLVLAAFGAAGIATSAMAQDRPVDNRGIYLALEAGRTSLSRTDLVFQDDGGTFGGTGAQDSVATRTETKAATGFGGALGYDFGTIRADIEVDYARNRIRGLGVQSVNGQAVTSISASDAADFCSYADFSGCSVDGTTLRFDGGRVRQASGLFNLWLDLPLSARAAVHAGGGAGIGGFEVDGEGKARFAWQVGAGAALHLSRAVAITADYRYRQINGATFTDAAFPDYALRVGKLKSNIASVGLRFTF